MAKTVFIYSQEEHVSFTGDEFQSAKWKPFVFRSRSSAQCCSRSDQCWRPHWRNSQRCAQEPGAAVLTHRSSSAEGLRRSSWLGRLWARLSDPASDSTSRLKVLSNSPFLLKLDCVQLRILWYWNTVLYHSSFFKFWAVFILNDLKSDREERVTLVRVASIIDC